MFEHFKKIFMNNDFDRIEHCVYKSIEKSKRRFDEEFPNEKLRGFALCTDDDVSSLFNVACTESWILKNSKECANIGYICTEWEQSVESELFDNCNEMISNNYNLVHTSNEAWSIERDKRFDALVRALKKARKDGLFDNETLLLVSSNDASDYMEELNLKAVKILNGKDIVSKYLEMDRSQNDD